MTPEVEAMRAAVAEMRETVEGLKVHLEGLHKKQMSYLVKMNHTMDRTLEEYDKRLRALEPPDGPNGKAGGGLPFLEGG